MEMRNAQTAAAEVITDLCSHEDDYHDKIVVEAEVPPALEAPLLLQISQSFDYANNLCTSHPALHSPSIGGVSYCRSVIFGFPTWKCQIVGRWTLVPSVFLYPWLSDVEKPDRWPRSCCNVGVILISIDFIVWAFTTVDVVVVAIPSL
uniref:Uncharacterized protein n=1 Tax=Glossina austeni TaxID=7395 RepID=A0A1A9UWM0_GLOAU